jgi:hypothetical protein
MLVTIAGRKHQGEIRFIPKMNRWVIDLGAILLTPEDCRRMQIRLQPGSYVEVQQLTGAGFSRVRDQ